MRTQEQIIELARKCQALDRTEPHWLRMTAQDLERFYAAAHFEGEMTERRKELERDRPA